MDHTNCVREATPEDKQAVLQIIDNVYDGLDYLPEYYDYFQNSEYATQYVYIKDKKIIAYVACFRADNGETMVSRAGRVSPKHQGKHVYKDFISEVETLQKAKGLLLCHAILKSTPPSESFLRAYKPVAAKVIHMFEYHRSDISSKLQLLTAGQRTEVKVLSNIPAEFLSQPFSTYLFPEGRVIIDWVPFRLSLSNVPLFKGRNPVFVSDIVHANETNTQNEAAHPLAGIRGLLSACTVFKPSHGLDLSCIVDIFGNDVHSLRDHIIFHLQQVDTTGLENINLQVYTTKGAFENSFLDEIFGSFEIARVTSGPMKKHYIELVVYEQEK